VQGAVQGAVCRVQAQGAGERGGEGGRGKGREGGGYIPRDSPTTGERTVGAVALAPSLSLSLHDSPVLSLFWGPRLAVVAQKNTRLSVALHHFTELWKKI
jgi:hypothetical protein